MKKLKVNFTQAPLLDLNNQPIVNDKNEPEMADYKYLANAIYSASYDSIGIRNLDKLELARQINLGQPIELTEHECDLFRNFFDTMLDTNGVHVLAWIKCLDQPE